MPRKVHLLRLAEAKRNQLKQSITVYGTVYRFEFRVLRSLFILKELLYNEMTRIIANQQCPYNRLTKSSSRGSQLY